MLVITLVAIMGITLVMTTATLEVLVGILVLMVLFSSKQNIDNKVFLDVTRGSSAPVSSVSSVRVGNGRRWRQLILGCRRQLMN